MTQANGDYLVPKCQCETYQWHDNQVFWLCNKCGGARPVDTSITLSVEAEADEPQIIDRQPVTEVAE